MFGWCVYVCMRVDSLFCEAWWEHAALLLLFLWYCGTLLENGCYFLANPFALRTPCQRFRFLWDPLAKHTKAQWKQNEVKYPVAMVGEIVAQHIHIHMVFDILTFKKVKTKSTRHSNICRANATVSGFNALPFLERVHQLSWKFNENCLVL